MQLELEAVSKTYANGTRALDAVTLRIPRGMFGLLGPNGAGKSTLMRSIATLQDVDSGSLRFGEIDIRKQPERLREVVGYLPQDFGVYPKVSAWDMLEHLAELKGLFERAARRDAVASLLHKTNLWEHRSQRLGGFSGGMKQRFGIAQALLGNPQLIIVDEPTAGLDPAERMRFRRRHARFALDTPTLNFFSVLSARYAVKRDHWRDVSLEIYHHPTHTFNLERMLRGMKDALGYCTRAFGPYQHKTVRIVEFPRYAMFAQAFPNTVPYSEAVGFIARVRDSDPDDINYPYYITAHEVAHQWWAHQVIGANVRGATMTSETLAQYSALMVMKNAYDARHMRRFLKFELDRYLVGRATERERELPLAQNENQPYIHYNKGSVAMYALQDFIGQERVDRALRRYLEAFKWRGPPYSTAADLVGYLRDETPAEYRYLIEDLFETITLYDNRATSATIKQAADGAWDVTVHVVARKFRSDERGAQSELQFADYMDIGALDGEGNALFIERRKLPRGESEQRFRVRERPAKVGVDPLNKLIDRQSDDNVVAPTLAL